MRNNDIYADGTAVSMEELGLINGRKKLRIARRRQRKIDEREFHVKHEPRKARENDIEAEISF